MWDPDREEIRRKRGEAKLTPEQRQLLRRLRKAGVACAKAHRLPTPRIRPQIRLSAGYLGFCSSNGEIAIALTGGECEGLWHTLAHEIAHLGAWPILHHGHRHNGLTADLEVWLRDYREARGWPVWDRVPDTLPDTTFVHRKRTNRARTRRWTWRLSVAYKHRHRRWQQLVRSKAYRGQVELFETHTRTDPTLAWNEGWATQSALAPPKRKRKIRRDPRTAEQRAEDYRRKTLPPYLVIDGR